MSTSSTALQQYQAEVIIDNNTGASYLSQAALARICKTSSTVIRFALREGFETKTAEVLTAAGLRSVKLYAEDAIAHSIVKYNPELAKQLLQLGVRTLLHKLAGWQAPQPKPTTLRDADVVELAFEALGRVRNLHKSNMPGLEQLFFTTTDEQALPPEHKTAKEIAGDRISPNYLSSFGRYLTSLYVELYRTEPPKKLEEGRLVNSYPYTLWNAIDTYANR